MSSLLAMERAAFHKALVGSVLTIDGNGVASNADKDSRLSKEIALRIATSLSAEAVGTRLPGQSAGNRFEEVVERYLTTTFLRLSSLRTGSFQVGRLSSRTTALVTAFDQYSHLSDLANLASSNPLLAVALGSDYLIAPDVIVFREPEQDRFLNSALDVVDTSVAKLSPLRAANGGKNMLHASVSCKWTLRSDRAQNAKSEALNLVRHRKGPLPHIVAVTGEPLPSRIASLAMGTGDLNCVYHFALDELVRAVSEVQDHGSVDILNVMIDGKRLKDISDLPLDLSI